MAFEVKGEFRKTTRGWQNFTIEVASKDEDAAIEKTFSLMGSRHGVKRQFIRIGGVKTLKPEEITDHRVKYLLEAND
ncbi:MAG: 50S ribosomal protein LX [Methanobacteriota archaeon]|nr:MAG: 50S ribosomal protein LX [Euryarchaeota archaeon]